MRIPYTGPLPPPTIIPNSASSVAGAASALVQFLSAPPLAHLRRAEHRRSHQTVLLTGAGISVASGLADYRGTNGTYTQNKSYRPIYYHEFVESHEARKRYWARSFLGWTSLHKAKPNAAHFAIGELARKGFISSVITQNVDSFHSKAHPHTPIIELHGYLRSLVCINCNQLMPRDQFQQALSQLNPAWATFLEELLRSGALDTENPEERRKKGYRTNPDGDADVPNAPYTTFRYPACPACLTTPPKLRDGSSGHVEVDQDGAWSLRSNAGILKPNVVMFGESIPSELKIAADEAVNEASRILIVGSSLATYSAWRLVKRAHEKEMPIAILNLGGVRKEEIFFTNIDPSNRGETAVRASQPAEVVLPALLNLL
jgi:NAD+-dependent protein deacetylase sirtuin 4